MLEVLALLALTNAVATPLAVDLIWDLIQGNGIWT